MLANQCNGEIQLFSFYFFGVCKCVIAIGEALPFYLHVNMNLPSNSVASCEHGCRLICNGPYA